MSKTVPHFPGEVTADPTRLHELQSQLLLYAPEHEVQRLAEVVANAEAHKDLDRLQWLHLALTDKRPISHYAGWDAYNAERAAELIEASLARLTPKPRKKRSPRPPEPISDAYAQSDLFENLNRWPIRPYCTNDLSHGICIRTLRHAITRAYIQANPPHLKCWLIFDIDRPNAVSAWSEADLLPPRWATENPENTHAHLVWGLTVPVLVNSPAARNTPIRYAAAIEAMMRTRLDADDGFSGLLTKNPSHARWNTLRGPQVTYTLAELAQALPGIEKFVLKPHVKAHQVGLGRNCHIFELLRQWAYKAIRPYWGEGLGGWNAWVSQCNSRALVMNGQEFGSNHMDPREVWHIAKSVAKYTWANTTKSGFSSWQSMQGKKGAARSAKVRAAASEADRASARLMYQTGASYRAIAAELDVSKTTVERWCADIKR